MKEFDKELLAFTDEDGLILERPNSSEGPETGNGIHGLCVATLIRFELGILNSEHLSRFFEVIQSCEFAKQESEGLVGVQGLYNRGPRKLFELISHDDYRALSAVSNIVSAPFSKHIEQFGSRSCWSFNNLHFKKWTWRSWHGRFPGVVPKYKLFGGRDLWPHEIAAICLPFYWTAYSKDAGAHLLSWMEAKALRGRIWCVDKAIEFWEMHRDHHFGSMAGVMREYYQQVPGQPDHPFARFFPKG